MKVSAVYYRSDDFLAGRVEGDGGTTFGFVIKRKGVPPEVREGAEMDLRGTWVTSKYGLQVDSSSVDVVSQDEKAGFISSMMRFIPKAKRTTEVSEMLSLLWDDFGTGTENVLCQGGHPNWSALQGKGYKMGVNWILHIVIEAARLKFERESKVKILGDLKKMGVRGKVAERIFDHFGDDSVESFKQSPYRMAIEYGLKDFDRMDEVGKASGIPPTDTDRLKLAVVSTMETIREAGHCSIGADALIDIVATKLGVEVDDDAVMDALDLCAADVLIVVDEGDMIYPYDLHESECIVARNVIVRQMCRERVEVDRSVSSAAMRQAADELGIVYTDEQETAVTMAWENPISIITGGPGTGKTTVCKAIVSSLEKAGYDVALCCPTGRGAKKLSETVGKHAMTIHRLIGYDPNLEAWEHDLSNQLPHSAIIVDESGMVDIDLMRVLMDATPGFSRLILVGDYDQLPSVGPGRLLRDLIEIGSVPVTRLNRIFRQKDGSDIIGVSHDIRTGSSPNIDPLAPSSLGEGSCSFYHCDDAIVLSNKIPAMVKGLASTYGLDPMEVQVLTPMRKGPLGTEALNQILQGALNPSADRGECSMVGMVFRVGDKVMQVRNDYDRGIFNGDSGIIIEADEAGITVRFDGGWLMSYDRFDVPLFLQHSYALTIHKCIAGDSLVLSESGFKQIREVCGMGIKNGELKPIDEMVMGKDGMRKAVQSFMGEEEPSITIITSRGYSLEGSHRHPVLVWNMESLEYEFRRLPDLVVGDTVLIQRGQGVFSSEYVPVSYHHPIDGNGKRRKNKGMYPPEVDERVGELMGYLVGDGSYNRNKGYDIVIHTSDEIIADRFGSLIKEMFGGIVKLNTSTSGRSAKTYYYIDSTCREWLLAAGLDFLSCRNKRIPKPIMLSPMSVQASFLRALFDTDGSASGNGTRVTLSTSSRWVAEETHVMLLNFGIISRMMYVEQTNSFRIEMYGQETVRFQEVIGFGLPHKADSLKSVTERSLSRDGKTNIDNIPGASVLVEGVRSFIRDKLGSSYRGEWSMVPARCQKTISSIITGAVKNVSMNHLRMITDSLNGRWEWLSESSHFQKMVSIVEDGFFFDQVTEINHGVETMFDISVPEGESFFSNGFISHNSQGSEFPVGIVVMHGSHRRMLQRNLLYTGISRFKRSVIVCGQRSAMTEAIRNDLEESRNTGLKARMEDVRTVLEDM